MSSCLRQTHGGSYLSTGLYGIDYVTELAPLFLEYYTFVRQSYVQLPECPGLLNDMLDMYCINAARASTQRQLLKMQIS